MSAGTKLLHGKPLGKCVCGKDIFADFAEYAVMHEMPYCAEFEALEPDEFLAFVRRSRGISDQVMQKILVLAGRW